MAVNIIKESRDFTAKERYAMTMSNNITSIKDVENGEHIVINGFLIFEDIKKDGNAETIMSMITPDNKVYSCQSATFKENVMDMFAMLGADTIGIIKQSGVTKAGRDFVYAELDMDYPIE